MASCRMWPLLPLWPHRSPCCPWNTVYAVVLILRPAAPAAWNVLPLDKHIDHFFQPVSVCSLAEGPSLVSLYKTAPYPHCYSLIPLSFFILYWPHNYLTELVCLLSTHHKGNNVFHHQNATYIERNFVYF